MRFRLLMGFRRSPARILALGFCAAVALMALPPLASGHHAGSPASFVSLGGAGAGIAIERFSLVNGRHLGVVARVPRIRSTSEQSDVSNPHLMPGGRYLITIGHDVNCRPVVSSECIPVFNTCASRIETLDPNSKQFRLLFTESGNRLVLDAVPSPDGRHVALLERGCGQSAVRIVIRDLRTGSERVAAGNLGLCTAVSRRLSWSLDGSRIVFLYGAQFSGSTRAGGCSLAVASSRHYSQKSAWSLIAPDGGCGFSSAAFDPTGLVAVEGCGPAETGGTTELLQFDRHLHLIRRLSLLPGTPGVASSEETEVANDPQAETVLVSQGEHGANAVWAFNGRRLRLIRRYGTNRVLAEP
jgi:hypothetical protein